MASQTMQHSPVLASRGQHRPPPHTPLSSHAMVGRRWDSGSGQVELWGLPSWVTEEPGSSSQEQNARGEAAAGQGDGRVRVPTVLADAGSSVPHNLLLFCLSGKSPFEWPRVAGSPPPQHPLLGGDGPAGTLPQFPSEVPRNNPLVETSL